MIWIKGILLLAILLASSYIGFLISDKYKRRVEELKEIKKGLHIFETKIRYTGEPIPEIFSELSMNLDKNIGKLFKDASHRMQEKTAKDAWQEAINNLKTSMTKEDKEVLKGLGKLLGKTDIEGQVSQIDLTSNFMDSQIEKAEKELLKNDKLYRTLGVVSGLALVIILI